MIFFVLVLCLLLTSSLSIVGGDQDNVRTPIKYIVLPRSDISSIPALIVHPKDKNTGLTIVLPGECFFRILSELVQEPVHITTVNEAFCSALIVHLYSDIQYEAFSKFGPDGRRIQLHGLLRGINEGLLFIHDELGTTRMCDFLKRQKKIKLYCPSHVEKEDPCKVIASNGDFCSDIREAGRPQYLLSTQKNSVPWCKKTTCVITEAQYAVAREKGATTVSRILHNLKDNKNIVSFSCAGGDTDDEPISSAITITASMVKKLQHLTSIKKLELSKLRIEEDAGKVLVDFIHNHEALEVLNLEDSALAEETKKSLLDSFNSKLKILNIGGWRLAKGSVKNLVGALDRSTTLTSLYAGRAWHGLESTALVSNTLRVNTTLTLLSLQGAELDSNSVDLISNALCTNTTLTELLLDDRDTSVHASPEKLILHCTNIKYLSLYNGASFLNYKQTTDALCQNTTLIGVSFGGNHITRDTAQKLRCFMDANTSLTTLYLENMMAKKYDEAEITRLLSTTKIMNLSFDEEFDKEDGEDEE